MAKNQLESNDSSLLPTSDNREDSGLQDLLSVAAKLKDMPEDEPSEAAGDQSGVIMFTAGDLGGDDDADEEDAVFGSFSGGLAAGFVTPSDPITSPDLTPLGGGGTVSEATGAEVRPKPAEEPKRSPMTAIAVVLGLGLAALGIVYVTNNDKDKPQQQQAQAEMSANNEDAAVGKAELPAEDPAGASGGQPIAPEPEPEPEPLPEGETEGALLQGEDAGGLLAADTSDADPMAQKAGLLDSDGKPVSKPSGKWDQGKSINDGKTPEAEPDVEPEPDPEPQIDPKPVPEPQPTKPSGGGSNDDEVDCLLNPDLPKCNTGGTSKPKDEEVLAPKLSESLDQTQLKSGFNTVKSKAKACGSKFGAEAGTKVKVHVSIEGSTGKVTSVSAQGEHAGTELGKCVEDAVKGASFDKFKKPSQGADYSMIM